jgi:hypothetical protein
MHVHSEGEWATKSGKWAAPTHSAVNFNFISLRRYECIAVAREALNAA